MLGLQISASKATLELQMFAHLSIMKTPQPLRIKPLCLCLEHSDDLSDRLNQKLSLSDGGGGEGGVYQLLV